MSSVKKSKGDKNQFQNPVTIHDPNLAKCRTARIRCLLDCVKAVSENKALPEALCFVSLKETYHVDPTSALKIFDSPSKDGTKIMEFKVPQSNSVVVVVSGEEFANKDGKWLKVKIVKSDTKSLLDTEPAWVLVYPTDVEQVSSSLIKCQPILYDDVDSSKFFRVEEKDKEQVSADMPSTSSDKKMSTLSHISSTLSDKKMSASSPCTICRSVYWEDVLEQRYMLGVDSFRREDEDMDAINRLRIPHEKWTTDCDAELARFLSELAYPGSDNYGSIKSFVENIVVSTTSNGDTEPLMDENPDTFWESDGSQGAHWIRLLMKKGTIIQKLLLTIDGDDCNYVPSHVVVMAGTDSLNLQKVQETHLDLSFDDVKDICVMEDSSIHYPIIEIRILQCKDDGIDTRIHGIKIKTSKDQTNDLHIDSFAPETLVRFPILQGFDKEVLYRRSIALQRLAKLLDSVLPYLMPQWDYSTKTFNKIYSIRYLLPLLQKRSSLVHTLLKRSETFDPDDLPKVNVNRRAAAAHKQDPSVDPECRNTVFMQIYHGLKPKGVRDTPLDYRWPIKNTQWWECRFIGEGIIDQGGGFRDSIADMSEELCPGSVDDPVPLPLFVRAPNQSTEDDNVNRDVYVPNPAYTDYDKYHWLGQLMGACFRSKESLVLSLPAFIWKQLCGDSVTWSRDYVTVDAAEVKLLERIKNCDSEAFQAHFGDWLCWTCLRSDCVPVPLRENNREFVTYDERVEYCEKVKDTRMNESKSQTDAIRKGLLEVIPESVLNLMTWHELENRVCGDPEISLEALKKNTRYDDLDEDSPRYKYLWDALAEFSNEDRSRYLRFVTGRRRLPAHITVCRDRDQGTNALPESSTCSNTLFLPNYYSSELCKEKLRYAVYNCVAIDSDMLPWDE